MERSGGRNLSRSSLTHSDPIHELPREQGQQELYEFGRWTRAAVLLGAGHRAFHITRFYGPPKGDLARSNYADKLLKCSSSVLATSDPKCPQQFVATYIETQTIAPTYGWQWCAPVGPTLVAVHMENKMLLQPITTGELPARACKGMDALAST